MSGEKARAINRAWEQWPDIDPEAVAGIVATAWDAARVPLSAPSGESAATLAHPQCRPSPVTREAVARFFADLEPDEDWPTNAELGGGPTGTRDDEYRSGMLEQADEFLSRFSLLEPAEVEWAHAANGDEFMDWSDDPKGAVAYRTKAGVPVKGTEQWDDEKCAHEEFYLGRCVACGTADDREYDPDDMPTIRAASEMAGCQNRGWYHDGSEEAEAHAQKRPVRPCPHHDGRNR